MQGTIGKAQSIKTILFNNIFDESAKLAFDVVEYKEIIEYLHDGKYFLKIAADVADDRTRDDCLAELERLGIHLCFTNRMIRSGQAKWAMLDELVTETTTVDGKKIKKIEFKDVNFKQIAVIDDHVARGSGLNWGFVYGATTVWLRRDKFAHEIPPENQVPTYTIDSLEELKGIFKQKAGRR